ncbi:hypothetical protein ASA1KI_44670 [Opitutales bacterium ASA1]|nr:hypothetical protein ASA1KI_44670 [Opitutales bacterium ASA1]
MGCARARSAGVSPVMGGALATEDERSIAPAGMAAGLDQFSDAGTTCEPTDEAAGVGVSSVA